MSDYANSYPRVLNFTADVLADTASIRARKAATGGSNKYELLPQGIMVTDAIEAVDAVVVAKMFGDDKPVTLYLKTNVLYPIAIDEITKAGTTTKTILIFGQ